MEEKKIYKAIPAIMEEIGHIGKDKKNQQQGFMFRGIDQVMNTMKPLLAKHGVFVLPVVTKTTREERLTKSGGKHLAQRCGHRLFRDDIVGVDFHFIADDGSEVVATIVGEGMDSADKSSNKAMAVAFKYACFQVFCIPTEEMSKADPDGYAPEESRPTVEQLRTYIGNCDTLAEFADMKANWGAYIGQDAELASYANQRYAEIKKGGAQ